jgi:hypothetical protein
MGENRISMEFSTICRTGACSALRMMSMPTFWSLLLGVRLSSERDA